MTALADPPPDLDALRAARAQQHAADHYPAHVAYDREARTAHAAVNKHARAQQVADDALAARDEAVRDLYLAMDRDDPENAPSPTEIARLTELHASTVRAITRDLARARRARG